ncbi:MAG: glycosyltransferase, partial [Bacteroidia bacterium]|nr:glycosyltransferase [Bacteroidia bacterium]
MTDSKIKILFILPSLRAGGAERVISFVAENIDKSSFDPILLIIGNEDESVYKTNPETTIFLNKRRVLLGIHGIYKHIRKLKPQIVVTSVGHLTGITAFIGIFFRKIKFVTRETNIRRIKIQYNPPARTYTRFVSHFSYRFLDLAICQSQDMATETKRLYNFKDEKIRVINNPITTTFNDIEVNDINNGIPQFITVGRLSRDKGHARVLEALAKLDFNFNYLIIGKGQEKEHLDQLIKDLNLESKIETINYTNKVPEFLQKADVFLQGSYAEGFPNALLESCAVGTPALAFKSVGGTSEIIDDG